MFQAWQDQSDSSENVTCSTPAAVGVRYTVTDYVTKPLSKITFHLLIQSTLVHYHQIRVLCSDIFFTADAIGYLKLRLEKFIN